jgi:hypothetical protein
MFQKKSLPRARMKQFLPLHFFFFMMKKMNTNSELCSQATPLAESGGEGIAYPKPTQITKSRGKNTGRDDHLLHDKFLPALPKSLPP